MSANTVFSPFEKMECFSLNHPVITCQEAASAKGIPLHNELKSLIINTSKGLCVLHIPGNKKANLRSIKKAIKADEACLAGEAALEMLQVKAGTVTPFLKQIWDLPQFISNEVLLNDFVSTNAGVRDKYIIFDPKMLMAHTNIMIGCFHRS